MSREWDEGILTCAGRSHDGECESDDCEDEHEEGLKSFVHILRFQDSKKEINRAHTVWRSAC